MGIDAEMFARFSRVVSDEEILDVSRRMVDALGVEGFFLRDRIYEMAGDECRTIEGKFHALRRVNSVQEDSDRTNRAIGVRDGCFVAPKGGTLVQASLWTRYYGTNYERGDLPLILNVAHFLKAAWPDCEIWYGGDSSGVKFRRLDEGKHADELWAHLVAHGHRSYVGSFGAVMDRDDVKRPPDCERCHVSLLRTGFGARFGVYVCWGCGSSLETNDGGKTFIDRKKRADDTKRRLYELSRNPLATLEDLREAVRQWAKSAA